MTEISCGLWVSSVCVISKLNFPVLMLGRRFQAEITVTRSACHRLFVTMHSSAYGVNDSVTYSSVIFSVKMNEYICTYNSFVIHTMTLYEVRTPEWYVLRVSFSQDISHF
jgi:hypothetical protein